LPNYKLRYKPFFHWTADDADAGDCDIQPNGLLTVKLAELSRLMAYPGAIETYCTITLESNRNIGCARSNMRIGKEINNKN